ncbi:transposase, partial [Streptomyces rimosus]|uniref:transposase n=1 Tax=Streptomyces rimosus TaxID=1927 RepID=UPI000A677CCC
MGPLSEELRRLEAAAREQVEQLRKEIAELTGQLSVAEERVMRLQITRETVAEILDATDADEPAAEEAARRCFSDLRMRRGCRQQAGGMGRGDLTNAEWDRLESFLPRGGTRGGRWSDHRRVINGVLYRVRTGVQWRDLPERFGPWETVYKRHRRWSADGTWKMLLAQIQAAEDAAGRVDRDVSVDS